MKLSRYLPVTLMLGIGFCPGCSPDAADQPGAQSPAQDQEVPGDSVTGGSVAGDSLLGNSETAGESSTFTGTGIVMNITPSRTFIVIEHQEISGFMGAMTMPFAINDESVLKSIAVGDSIDFELTVSGSETYVSSISSAVQ